MRGAKIVIHLRLIEYHLIIDIDPYPDILTYLSLPLAMIVGEPNISYRIVS